MKNAHLVIFAMVIVALCTMGFQCGKEYPIVKPAYEYIEKLTLTPYKKTYSVGDTIRVSFQTASKTLFDKLSGGRIATDTTFLQLNFNYHKRYPIGNTAEFFSDANVDRANDVSFTTVYTYYNVLSFKTDCSNVAYFFNIAFVPKKTGVYSIEPNGGVMPCPAKSNMPLSTFKFTFDLNDCNKDVWLSIPPASRGGELGYTDVRIDNKEMFVFRVE